MTRLEANIKILNITKQLVYMFPDMRFIQLLTTVDAIIGTDQFYEESEVTLNRMIKVELYDDFINKGYIKGRKKFN